MTTLLGIETSCDETAAAVVVDGQDVRSSVVASQARLHSRFGGVVPEIACRAHIESLLPVVAEALMEAKTNLRSVDAIAVTVRPGLVGALLVGLSAGKAMAWALDKPWIAVDHIEAHLYACRMAFPDMEYPAVGLVASGGHTSLFLSRSPVDVTLLGATEDDAAGEAFDKVAGILGLGYPGGPEIDRVARSGDPRKIRFKRSKAGSDDYDFSFSGLKTAVLYRTRGQDGRRKSPLREHDTVPDVAASFQEAVVDILVRKTLQAARRKDVRTIAVGGGVACNSRLRARLSEAAHREGFFLAMPPPRFCTDNAVMIAGLGYHRLRHGPVSAWDVDADPGT